MRLDRVKVITEMARQNITRKRLSEITGISPSTITSITSGKSCSTVVGTAIINALGAEPEELLEEVRR